MMKTLVMYRKLQMIVVFAFVVSIVLPIFPAWSTTEFEVGTQFGISHLLTDDSDAGGFTLTQIPGGLISGLSLPSLYATWFPSQRFAVGPEFSVGNASIEDMGITSVYLGGKVAYFLKSHATSSPYILGRFSLYTLSAVDDFLDEIGILANFGVGFGYQWRIGPAFILRTEAQYQRLFPSGGDTSDFEDNLGVVNELSLIIGIGTRFGSGEK